MLAQDLTIRSSINVSRVVPTRKELFGAWSKSPKLNKDGE